MKKNLKGPIKISIFLFFSLVFSSCGLFESKITFKGKVYYGRSNSETGGITVYGVLGNATVREKNHPETARADIDGNYTLTLSLPFTLGYANSANWTLEATGYYGANEAITVSGRPGETIAVREFILYQHEVEGGSGE